MMRGDKTLIDLRKRGYKPTSVMLGVGYYRPCDLGLEAGSMPSVDILPDELGPSLDLRFLVGVRVLLTAQHEAHFADAMDLVAEAGAAEIFGWCAETDEILIYQAGQWRAHPAVELLEAA
jgi:hypothetical protein